MAVDLGVRRRRSRNRLACRLRRTTIRAGELRGTLHYEEAEFAGGTSAHKVEKTEQTGGRHHATETVWTRAGRYV